MLADPSYRRNDDRVSEPPRISATPHGLTESAQFWPVVGLTALITAAISLGPQPPEAVALSVLVGVIVALGIPHGAVDHLVSREPADSRTGFDWEFHFWYVGVILLSLALWLWNPRLALGLFLAVSVYHFGQSDLGWCELPRPQMLLLQLSRGLFLVGLPLTANPARVVDTILQFGPDFTVQAEWLTDTATVWALVLPVQHLVIGAAIASRSNLARRTILREAAGFAGLTVLFLAADPFIGFALYFGLWHSLGHIILLRQELSPDPTPVPWRRFFELALPRSVISTAAMFGVVAVLVAVDRVGTIAPAAIVLLSAITTPHLFVVERLWNRRRLV